MCSAAGQSICYSASLETTARTLVARETNRRPHYPSVDESLDRPRRAGWSVGEVAGTSVWCVSGTNGENVIKVEGRTQAKAWYRAVLQARACGMLATAERQRARRWP